MRKYFAALVVLATTSVFLGCSIESSTEVYLSDFYTVLETGRPETASINYLIEMPTGERCKLHGPKLAELFKSEMVELSRTECLTKGLNSFLSLVGRIELVRGTIQPNESVEFKFSGLSALGVHPSKGNHIVVTTMLSKAVFEKLATEAKAIMGPSASSDFRISKIGVTVNNDTRKDEAVLLWAGFADGKPVVNGGVILKARSKVEIVASSVHEKMLMQSHNTEVFELAKVEATPR